MKKAIILDRDGVINQERGTYTWRLQDFKYKKGLWELLKAATKKGYLLFSITNQSGIAKNIYSYDDFYKIRNKIYEDTLANKTPIHEILFCPHHPDVSKCLCRKPASLLYEKIIHKYNINPEISFVIGDKERDLISGKKLNMKTILVPSVNTKVYNTDYIVENLEDIIYII